jgi:hypothetical protein
MTRPSLSEQVVQAGIHVCTIIIVGVALAAGVMLLALLIALIGAPMIALVDVVSACVQHWTAGWKP